MLRAPKGHLLNNGDSVVWPLTQFPPSALNHSVTDRFENIVRLFPDRRAICDRIRSLTYAEVFRLVEYIAQATTAMLADRPGPVAILLPHEARFPAAILGVLASGRGCIPLDADDPIERIRLIAADASASAVVSAGALAHKAGRLLPDLPILDIERTDAPRAKAHRAKADDLAFIIYTSGSSGTPRGVYQNHLGLLHDILQCTATEQISCEDRLALFNSPRSISGFRIALSGLLNGAAVCVIVPRDLQPAELVREIRGRGITILRSVPSLFRHVVRTLREGETLETVRLVMLGGDRVDWRDFEMFIRSCPPGAQFGVHLGATECSTIYLQWYVDALMPRTGLLPVGRCVPDRTVKLVDPDGQPVPDGEIGEFVVSSRYLALGYWQAPELTARAFSIDAIDPQARVFKTGDLGRRRSDGLFEHIGRKDDQIKLHGHRIDPAEIESVLRGFPQVKEAAVVVRRDEFCVPESMVAYVEPSFGFERLQPSALRSPLTKHLPRYMIPATIKIIEQLPRLSNLKLDRVRLAQMDAECIAEMINPVDDPLITEIIKLFESVLGSLRITPGDNVSSLGGDSLQAIKVALELELRFGIAIPVEVFESMQSIRELARWLTTRFEPLDDI